MRSIIQFFMRFGTILLFLLFEGISLYLIVNYNENQKSIFNNTFLVIQGKVQERYENTLDYLSLAEEIEKLRQENALLHKGSNSIIWKHTSGTDSLVWEDTVYHYQFYPAQVISNSLNFRHNNITLNKGTKHSIHEGMGVLAAEGVVGVIRNTSKNYSSVLPLIHINSSVSTKVKRTAYFGNLEWKGGDHRIASLTAVPKHADIKKGDTIVTSGYSTIFPPDLNVGVVKELELPAGSNFYLIEVALFVDFGKIDNVYVIDHLQKNELMELKAEREDYE